MNDELKATLEWLKECGNNDYIFETGNSVMLLDYITNLQQENERLTQGITLLTNKVIDMTKSKEDYKSRCENLKKCIEKNVVWYER